MPTTQLQLDQRSNVVYRQEIQTHEKFSNLLFSWVVMLGPICTANIYRKERQRALGANSDDCPVRLLGRRFDESFAELSDDYYSL